MATISIVFIRIIVEGLILHIAMVFQDFFINNLGSRIMYVKRSLQPNNIFYTPLFSRRPYHFNVAPLVVKVVAAR